jgi:hypothetical protein
MYIIIINTEYLIMCESYEQLPELDNHSLSSLELHDLYGCDIVTNFYKLKRRRHIGNDDDGRPIHKKVNIKVYSSGERGSFIVNAETGYTSRCRVGSLDEKLFYSVHVSTGEGRNRQPISLYYDSPEQYESHYMTIVEPNIKQQWKQKNRQYLHKLQNK